ncbi:hypothetical protein KR054_001488, partial [Drosophila jambulina]
LGNYGLSIILITFLKRKLSAGAELLFGNIKRRELALDGSQKCEYNIELTYYNYNVCNLALICILFEGTIANLLKWMHANILTERPELFLQGDTVRPGILVLINDTDWELLGELDYELQPRDNVLFISTLHGG